MIQRVSWKRLKLLSLAFLLTIACCPFFMAPLMHAGNKGVPKVPPPEVMPEAKDSIVVIDYVVFYTRLEAGHNPASTSSQSKPGLGVSLKVHVENHSESTLKDFELKSITLYKADSRKEVATYKLTSNEGNSSLELGVHALKDLTYTCTRVSSKSPRITPGAKVYGRIWARYNSGDHFISTRPVEVK